MDTRFWNKHEHNWQNSISIKKIPSFTIQKCVKIIFHENVTPRKKYGQYINFTFDTDSHQIRRAFSGALASYVNFPGWLNCLVPTCRVTSQDPSCMKSGHEYFACGETLAVSKPKTERKKRVGCRITWLRVLLACYFKWGHTRAYDVPQQHPKDNCLLLCW